MLLGYPVNMTQAIPERRSMRRFEMRLPAGVKFAASDVEEIATETTNVSARGVFFFLDRSVAVGDNIDITLTFPPHVTLADNVRVRFSARVVRVEQQSIPGARVGVAAAIEGYEFLRSRAFENLESEEPGWRQ